MNLYNERRIRLKGYFATMIHTKIECVRTRYHTEISGSDFMNAFWERMTVVITDDCGNPSPNSLIKPALDVCTRYCTQGMYKIKTLCIQRKNVCAEGIIRDSLYWDWHLTSLCVKAVMSRSYIHSGSWVEKLFQNDIAISAK